MQLALLSVCRVRERAWGKVGRVGSPRGVAKFAQNVCSRVGPPKLGYLPKEE